MPTDNLPTTCNKKVVPYFTGPVTTTNLNYCSTYAFGSWSQATDAATNNNKELFAYAISSGIISAALSMLNTAVESILFFTNADEDAQQGRQIWALRAHNLNSGTNRLTQLTEPLLDSNGNVVGDVKIWNEAVLPSVPEGGREWHEWLNLFVDLSSTALSIATTITNIDTASINFEISKKVSEAAAACRYMSNYPSHGLYACNRVGHGNGQGSNGGICYIDLAADSVSVYGATADNNENMRILHGVPYTSSGVSKVAAFELVGQYTRNLLGVLVSLENIASTNTIWRHVCTKHGSAMGCSDTIEDGPLRLATSNTQPLASTRWDGFFSGVRVVFDAHVDSCTFSYHPGMINGTNVVTCSHAVAVDYTYQSTSSWTPEVGSKLLPTCWDPSEEDKYFLEITCNPFLVNPANDFIMIGLVGVARSGLHLVVPPVFETTFEEGCHSV